MAIGHFSHQDSLAKVILQGIVEGNQCRNRPMKSWLDNIKDWMTLPTAWLLRLVED